MKNWIICCGLPILIALAACGFDLKTIGFAVGMAIIGIVFAEIWFRSFLRIVNKNQVDKT